MWWSRATRLGRASIIIPNSPGDQAGGPWWTWKRPPIRDRRGTPCGCPPGSQRSPAGRSGRATGPVRHPVSRSAAVGGECRGGRPQGSPLRCGRRGRRGWCRASIIFPNSRGNHAGGQSLGGGPGNVRRSGTVGAPLVGAHRGRNIRRLGGRAAQPGRQGTRCHDLRRAAAVCRGRATTRIAPTMRSPQATRLGPGVDHLPRFPRNHAGGRWGRTWKVRGPGTVGAPLVGALRRGNVRLPGGGAVHPGRQGARPRPVVDDAVCRGGRPQGSPLRCGHHGRHDWGRASIIFPNSPGS